jgi:purine-nucleoside/S-methyl-5'-thioadenosine phosphorylase / adenosine deaminase
MGSKRGRGAAGQRGSNSTRRTTGEKKVRRGAQRTPLVSSRLREAPLAGAIPRFEIPGWQERYGVVAGITGRGADPGRGFDLGLWSKEPVGEVMSRWLAFRRGMSEFQAVALGNQVHGVEIMTLDQGRGWIYVEGIDAWITTAPGILLTVTIADCVPVYLVVPGRGVALLHAGWRGTAAGILERGLRGLLGVTGSSLSNVVMHCGVGICGDCYEVGSEVMTGCGVPAPGRGPWHIDLRTCLAEQARALGITQVTISDWCSAHDRSSFYSHRASRGTDGRMLAYIGMVDRQRRPEAAGRRGTMAPESERAGRRTEA